jgi:hypothetical protein
VFGIVIATDSFLRGATKLIRVANSRRTSPTALTPSVAALGQFMPSASGSCSTLADTVTPSWARPLPGCSVSKQIYLAAWALH